MSSRILTVTLAAGLLFSLLILMPRLKAYRLPGIQQGYEPDQPLEFSHRLHAGELQISCHYCHTAARVSRYAGFPAGNACLNCHRLITAPWGAVLAEDRKAQEENREPQRLVSAELRKLYQAVGLNENLEPDSVTSGRRLEWKRVHNLADYVYFDHRAHISAGVSCQKCHGPVETMERVRQIEDLTMGWCVNCHREAARTGIAGKAVNPSTDCAICHY